MDAADLHILHSCRSARSRSIIRDEEFARLLGRDAGIVYAGQCLAASPQWTRLSRTGRERHPRGRHAGRTRTLRPSAKLLEAGAPALASPHEWLGRLPIAWTADPYGHPIQIVQHGTR